MKNNITGISLKRNVNVIVPVRNHSTFAVANSLHSLAEIFYNLLKASFDGSAVFFLEED